ncbi:histidine--tRNA ligase [Spiroplasma endosymbiont of Aspidapion aeneum]|uniref:histidine--tRNA ligase n=1 Tax=Spiroplasma endosymbiont of Aspidapion aeneum TaxID=3066276 RepID=UPI00313D1281
MITKPRGTVDLYGKKARMYTTMKELVCLLMNNYHFEEIITPVFENEQLFTNGIGQETDIVGKEMFSFLDRKSRSMVLRPEFTAPVVRSVIENKLYTNPLPLKLFYFDKCFRYERPQKGRQREFWQFGVEIIGVKSQLAEVEAIQIIVNFLTILTIEEYKIRVNYLLTGSEREKYITELKKYLKNTKLCEDCTTRIEKNPLRVLDCKIDVDILKKAPKMVDYSSIKDKENFDKIIKVLKISNIQTTKDDNLVRGLDYYTGLIFEVDLKFKDGTYLTIAGGGRYDGLIEKLSGPALESVGFGLGLERLFLYIEDRNIELLHENPVEVYFVGLTDQSRIFTSLIANALRMGGVSCEINHDERSLKSSFKYCEQIDAKNIVVIGDDEVKSNTFKVKNQKTKKEKTIVGFEELVKYFIDNKKGN